MNKNTKESGERMRRGRQDIIMGILRCAQKGSTKYDMITAVAMNSAQCAKYLKYLTLAGYISEETSGIWTTTEKGLLVIDACQICHGYLPQIIESGLAQAHAEAREMSTVGKAMGKVIDRQKEQQARRARGGKKQKRR
jgi:predicted transcriptional regulator